MWALFTRCLLGLPGARQRLHRLLHWRTRSSAHRCAHAHARLLHVMWAEWCSDAERRLSALQKTGRCFCMALPAELDRVASLCGMGEGHWGGHSGWALAGHWWRLLEKSQAASIIHFVLLPTLMGSYGDRWLECSWCEKCGKCLDYLYLPAVSLTDIDGIGVLCDSCILRTEPVHYDYLRGLFLATISTANVFSPEIVERIADIAYEPCYNHRCHTEWSRWFHAALEDRWEVSGINYEIARGLPWAARSSALKRAWARSVTCINILYIYISL